MKYLWDATDLGGKCKSYLLDSVCFNDYHYEIIESNCSMRDCPDRRVSDILTLPCGSSDCFKDVDGEDGSNCVLSCSGNYHYMNDSDKGICTTDLMEQWTSRKINTSAALSCGSTDCFKDINALNGSNCVSTCGSNSKGIEGVCTSCGNINAFDVVSCSGGSLTNCYYKEGVDTCVTMKDFIV
ncbi:MAG: hypothetical protein LBB45_08470 [Methanobrevibacter sp.]|nr:hypothetical protein [Candidatus Methanovirga basalitermitum]